MPFGLILDVDGVLADTEALSAQACTDAFRELHGIEVPLNEHRAFIGATHEHHVQGLARRYGLRIDTARTVLAHLQNFLAAMDAADDISYPGVHALIRDVARYPEWRLGLATGSGRTRSEATIAKVSIDPSLFRAWVTGDDVERAKPDPEIYLRAASRLELFPRQCVVIEDSVAGLAAAKAASMHCIAVTNTFPGEALRAADRIVDSLEHISVTLLYDLVAGG
jgi:HAD superfamily hydrolase (TIGR01509 family)